MTESELEQLAGTQRNGKPEHVAKVCNGAGEHLGHIDDIVLGKPAGGAVPRTRRLPRLAAAGRRTLGH